MKKIKILLGILAVTLLLVSCAPVTPSEPDIPLGEVEAFAQCLTDNGASMYGTSWCSYCNKQKEMFGSAFDKVNFIDCEKDSSACSFAGVQGFPTWEIEGKLYPGLQTFEKLSELSGCELKLS